VMLLAIGLSLHESIALTTCVRCGIAMLADQLSLRRRTCGSCHRPAEPAVGADAKFSEQQFVDAEMHGELNRSRPMPG
jgi:hypothetical protein